MIPLIACTSDYLPIRPCKTLPKVIKKNNYSNVNKQQISNTLETVVKNPAIDSLVNYSPFLTTTIAFIGHTKKE